jgi:hypothetical protein
MDLSMSLGTRSIVGNGGLTRTEISPFPADKVASQADLSGYGEKRIILARQAHSARGIVGLEGAEHDQTIPHHESYDSPPSV